MPRTFVRPFRIRYYECDPYGHVNNANYLRYALQASVEATADAGYDFARLKELGLRWAIRETGIEYLRPARASDTLNVKTWISSFREARSRREFEMIPEGSRDVIVRAYTDWVYQDARTGQPAHVPEAMVAAFLPEGAGAEPPKPNPFAEQPPPPPGAFVTQRRLAWHHLDPTGQMNSAWYLSMLEDVTIDAASHAGWNLRRSAEAGFAYFVRDYRIQHVHPVVLGDEMVFTTYLSEFRTTSATRHYQIRRARDGELLARAQIIWVWVDATTGRPRTITEDFHRDFAAQLVSAGNPQGSS